MPRISKKVVFSIIILATLAAATAYNYRFKIGRVWNQTIYTSPLTWNNVTLYFDKTHIISKDDGLIQIYSLQKPESGAITILDSTVISIINQLESKKQSGEISIDEINSDSFKGFDCTTYKVTSRDTDFIGIHRDIPDAGISINYYGESEAFPHFEPLIEAIEIRN